MSGQGLPSGQAWSTAQQTNQTPPMASAPSRPDPPSTQSVAASGRFRKSKVKPMKRYGAYRGAGSLRLDQSGIHVIGKHVRPTAIRWLIGLAIFAACLILTGGRLFVGFIPLYFLLEYGLLESGDRTIPWTSVTRFVWNEQKKLVAIETDSAEKNDNPLVFASDQWREVIQALRAYMPGRGS
jgi:hypothetical protein